MQKRPKISPSRSSALKRAGDLAERVVRQAQLLGQQVERGVGARASAAAQLQVLARALQRLHVARAGDEHAFGRGVPAGALEQRLAQRLEAVAGAGRQRAGPSSRQPCATSVAPC